MQGVSVAANITGNKYLNKRLAQVVEKKKRREEKKRREGRKRGWTEERKKGYKDLLWIVPVSGYPLSHIRVTPHEISHELLGVDIRG